jgi:hypothetical protein
MRITRREHTLKRIVTVAAIITAFAVAPSVASAANKPALQKPQLTVQVAKVQVAKVQVAKVQRAQTAALSVQRHRVLISRAQAFSILLRMQIR